VDTTRSADLHLRISIVAVGIGAVLAQAPLIAQTAGRDDGALLPRWEFGPYAGMSRHSPAGRILGVTPDRDHLFVGFGLTANLIRRKRWAFGFAPEVVPLLLVSKNPRYRAVPTVNGGRFIIEDGRGPVAGFAMSPIGLQAQVRVASRLRTYVSSAAGVVWFTRPVPVAESRAFNYTFEFGAGVLWQYRPRDSLRVGYKFHHLSNAYSAPKNPGLDAAVFLVGYERVVGLRKQVKSSARSLGIAEK
jgi:hypothetical protein